jgi:hypothetical protein
LTSSGLCSVLFISRMLAMPVTKLRSTVARVLSRTGVLGSTATSISTLPGRRDEKRKPVTEPTRMPRIVT